MSDTNKTRYEVQKIISDCIKEGLTAYVGANHRFSVMEFAQASFQNANRIVLLKPIRARRVGWQGAVYSIVTEEFVRTDEWLEEQDWQVQIILKKSDAPDVSELQADDVAQLLITWFNGKGVESFRKSECAPLRIKDTSIIVYVDDSELYQKRAVFTFKLQVPKLLSALQDNMTIDEYSFPGVYGV